MFRRPSRAALYERLIAEKQQEIDWLRAQLGAGVPGYRPVPPPPPVVLADGEPGVQSAAEWMSEAEEARAILEADPTLSSVHLPEILDGLGYGNSHL